MSSKSNAKVYFYVEVHEEMTKKLDEKLQKETEKKISKGTTNKRTNYIFVSFCILYFCTFAAADAAEGLGARRTPLI